MELQIFLEDYRIESEIDYAEFARLKQTGHEITEENFKLKKIDAESQIDSIIDKTIEFYDLLGYSIMHSTKYSKDIIKNNKIIACIVFTPMINLKEMIVRVSLYPS